MSSINFCVINITLLHSEGVQFLQYGLFSLLDGAVISSAHSTPSQTTLAQTLGMYDCGHRYGSDFCMQQRYIYCAHIS